MTMLQMWIVAGVLVAGGVACLVWYLLPAEPDLGDVMARLRPGIASPSRAARTGAGGNGEARWSGRTGRWVERHLPPVLRGETPTRDLALLGKPVHVFYGEKLLHAVAALFIVPLLCGLLSMGLDMNLYVPTAATLLVAVLVWFAPNLDVKQQATRARAEFSRALASYIDLVALERKAGGAATRQALEDAALRGDSWPFRRIGEALARSDFARTQPADALHDMAVELGLPDLDDLADTMRLSGAEGVEVYDTLRARAGSMRQAKLTADLAQANATGERMGIPTTLMGVSIAMIVLVAVGLNLFIH